MKRILTVLVCAGLVVAGSLAMTAHAPFAPIKMNSMADAEADVQAILQKYADVYNKHDAKALAELWAPQAVSVDGATGARIVGREAIQADFQETFKAAPKTRLTIQLKNHRFMKPDILSVSGEVTIADEEDSDSATFSAILIKSGDTWLIEEATESPLTNPATPYDGLKELDWLVGNWQDDVPDLTVKTEVKWSASKGFLLRKYSIETPGDDTPDSGMQIIAWDARTRTIRSWTFAADGSFGEATWAKSGADWRIKFNHTNTDGSLLSGQQLINKVDNNTITVQLIGQELDGEPQPNGPAVKMVRK